MLASLRFGCLDSLYFDLVIFKGLCVDHIQIDMGMSVSKYQADFFKRFALGLRQDEPQERGDSDKNRKVSDEQPGSNISIDFCFVRVPRPTYFQPIAAKALGALVSCTSRAPK